MFSYQSPTLALAPSTPHVKPSARRPPFTETIFCESANNPAPYCVSRRCGTPCWRGLPTLGILPRGKNKSLSQGGVFVASPPVLRSTVSQSRRGDIFLDGNLITTLLLQRASWVVALIHAPSCILMSSCTLDARALALPYT